MVRSSRGSVKENLHIKLRRYVNESRNRQPIWLTASDKIHECSAGRDGVGN